MTSCAKPGTRVRRACTAETVSQLAFDWPVNNQRNSKFPTYFYVPVSVSVCFFAVKGVLSASGSGRVSSQKVSCLFCGCIMVF